MLVKAPSSHSAPTLRGKVGSGSSPKSSQRPLSVSGQPLLGGRFRVLREIGVGGMGAVYEVLHEVTQHRRALKLLKRKENDEQSVTRLLREASAAGRIGSPHIVDTFDAGLFEDGQAYVLMELLEGNTFFEYLREHPDTTLAELVELVCQACEGLAAAHEAGIIHRDVKPSNLFVVQRGGKPFVKVLDFGISKFDVTVTDQTQLTEEGMLLGTPSYMAPEQLSGTRDVDARIDVYALGIALYAATAGTRPFKGKTVAELAIAIDRADFVPLDREVPELPKDFVSVVHRAMNRDRERRPRTARELAAELREAIDASRETLETHVARAPAPEAPLAPRPGSAPVLPTTLTGEGRTTSAIVLDTHDVLTAEPTPVEAGEAEAPPPPRRSLAWLGLAAAAVLTIAGLELWNGRAPAAAVTPPVPALQSPPRAPDPVPSLVPLADDDPRNVLAPAPAPSASSASKPGHRGGGKPGLNRKNPYP